MSDEKQREHVVEKSSAGDAEITSTGDATESETRARIDKPFPARPDLPPTPPSIPPVTLEVQDGTIGARAPSPGSDAAPPSTPPHDAE